MSICRRSEFIEASASLTNGRVRNIKHSCNIQNLFTTINNVLFRMYNLYHVTSVKWAFSLLIRVQKFFQNDACKNNKCSGRMVGHAKRTENSVRRNEIFNSDRKQQATGLIIDRLPGDPSKGP